ncbi:MAG: MFS transporter, partial [Megasphaera micronuciformis]
GKNVGFASGVTLGLSVTIGGLLTPLVGWAADIWGIPTALQVLWICAAIGAIFTFSVREPKDAA